MVYETFSPNNLESDQHNISPLLIQIDKKQSVGPPNGSRNCIYNCLCPMFSVIRTAPPVGQNINTWGLRIYIPVARI